MLKRLVFLFNYKEKKNMVYFPQFKITVIVSAIESSFFLLLSSRHNLKRMGTIFLGNLF